jgi:hypothetical protein
MGWHTWVAVWFCVSEIFQNFSVLISVRWISPEASKGWCYVDFLLMLCWCSLKPSSLLAPNSVICQSSHFLHLFVFWFVVNIIRYDSLEKLSLLIYYPTLTWQCALQSISKRNTERKPPWLAYRQSLKAAVHQNKIQTWGPLNAQSDCFYFTTFCITLYIEYEILWDLEFFRKRRKLNII